MGKGTISDARLSAMVKDLRDMKAFLLPNDTDGMGEEMQGMDDFHKVKARLSMHINDVSQNIRDYNDLRKKVGQTRNPKLIGLQNDIHKDVVKAKSMLDSLRSTLEKDERRRRKKLAPDELAHRKRVVELFSDEIRKLDELNSRVSRGSSNTDNGNDPTSAAIAHSQRRAQERALKRQQARERRRARQGATGDIPEDEDFTPAPLSQQEQVFMEEKKENDKKIDELLDVVSAGLTELTQISQDINRNLDLQNEMLTEVDDKMDDTIKNYKTANRKLKELTIEATGGASQWCPFIITFLILLAIVGYILNVA